MKAFKFLIPCIVLLCLIGCDEQTPIRSHATQTVQCSIQLPICVNQCCPSKPKGDTIVNHDIYVLSNNPNTKFADWVAYKVKKENLNGPSRKRYWRRDPLLPENETLSPIDYKGASAAEGYDRGHQAPLASFANNSSWEATNYLSNISPQRSSLNQGSWVKLESAVRKLATKYDSVFVVTGTLYEHDMPPLPYSHLSNTVPSGYFKIVALPRNGKEEVAAFILDQSTPKSDNFCDHQVSLTELRQRLSFDPFPEGLNDAESLIQEICY